MHRGLRARIETLIILISHFESFCDIWRILLEGDYAILLFPRFRTRAQSLLEQVLRIYSKIANQLVAQIIWLAKRPTGSTVLLVIVIKFITRCVNVFLCVIYAGFFLLLFGLEKIAEKGPCPR